MLFFDRIKEKRDNYYVEYRPDLSLSVLTLSFIGPTPNIDVVKNLMLKELQIWWNRYPCIIFTSAFNETDDDLSDSLVGMPKNGNMEVYWQKTSKGINENFSIFSEQDFIKMHHDINYKTQNQIRFESDKEYSKLAIGYFLIKLIYTLRWMLLPLIYETFLQFGPTWTGVISIGMWMFGIFQTFRSMLKLWGFINPSEKEKEKNEIEREKAYFYYHCKKNIKGFEKLRNENWDEEVKEKNRKTFDELNKEKKNDPASN